MLKGTSATEEARKHMSEARRGHPISEETRLARLGRHISDETKAKMSAAQKGKFVSEETKAKMSLAQKGHPVSDETRAKQSLVRKGKKQTIEWRRHISEAHMGEKSHCWKGGLTKEGTHIRNGMEYAIWRTSVFTRDDYTCQKCGAHSEKGHAVILEAHHMDSFADFPEERLDIRNGITFCEKCHLELHRRYGMVHNRKWQTDEFLETGEGQEDT